MHYGDDSGVYVEALAYFPGVHSRRWFGEEKDDHLRNQELLKLMKDEKERTTFLISSFALVNHDGELVFKTLVKNKYNLSYDEKGKKGFGYDNILIPTVYDEENSMWKNLFMNDRNGLDYFPDGFAWKTTTIGEMNQVQKNAITYRGRIAKEIKEVLEKYENI